MTNSFGFPKETLQWSQRVFDIKSPGPGLFDMGDKGTILPSKLNLVSVKKSVSVEIGKFIKIGVSMLFIFEEKIGIGMIFTVENWYRYQ